MTAFLKFPPDPFYVQLRLVWTPPVPIQFAVTPVVPQLVTAINKVLNYNVIKV